MARAPGPASRVHHRRGRAHRIAPSAPRRERVGMLLHRLRPVSLVAVLAAALLAGCGQSQEEKASAQVCTARDDMAKHVDQLKGMTLSTATTSQIKESLQAIKKDLSTIVDAQGNLSDERRKDVQAANEEFASSVRETVSSVGSTVSAQDAKAQLSRMLQQLADSYSSTFAKLDCA
jgi:hypothetical protein